MSQLNQKGTLSNNGIGNGRAVSGNGNVQHKKSHEQELFEIVVSTLYGKDQNFYESQTATLKRLENAVIEVVKSGNLDFIANAIIYARTNMHIRTMPLLLVGYFAKALRDQGKTYLPLRKVVCDVIQRADQIADMVSVAKMLFGAVKPKSGKGATGVQQMPMAFKRGIADAFNKFDEYSFAKYNRDGEVKLKDVLRIVHPHSKNEAQGILFEKIMKDTLETPYTWETRLTANGQLPESERLSKKDIWTELVKSGEMGYMALLRNLRNISEAQLNPDDEKEYVCNVISDRDAVLKSKQFPYAFLNAYDAIESVGSSRLKTAISIALDHSLSNLPVIGDNVWIIMDCSQSMTQTNQGGVQLVNSPLKTASIFTAALAKANADARNLKITMFSDRAEMVNVNTSDSIMSIAQGIFKKSYGGGTNMGAALELKKTLGFEPDTIVIISDMEVNRLSGGTVPSGFAPEAIKIALNLNSRDSTPIGEKAGWYQLAGWSEKLFAMIPAMRTGKTVVQTLSVPYLGMGIKKLG